MTLARAALILAFVPAMAFAQAESPPSDPAAAERIVGAIACVPARPFLLSHLESPSDDAARIGSVRAGNCYPTGGCDAGWCAVETVDGMGWIADVGVTVVIPQAEDEPTPDAETACGLYAILAVESSQEEAEALASRFAQDGATVLDNDRLPNFDDGTFSVAVGPLPDRQQAEAALEKFRDRAPDAQVKAACQTP